MVGERQKEGRPLLYVHSKLYIRSISDACHLIHHSWSSPFTFTRGPQYGYWEGGRGRKRWKGGVVESRERERVEGDGWIGELTRDRRGGGHIRNVH